MIQNCFRSVLVVCAFLALSTALHAQSRDALITSIASLPGWKAAGNAETFTESNIDQLDSRMAPILRTYGIDGVSVQSWHAPSGRVRATLYQFTDASTGYGFFTIQRKNEGVRLSGSSEGSTGTESFESENARYFWQARYVVRLEGNSTAVDLLARTLSENILGRSLRPPVSNHLPSANVVAGSEEYILDGAHIQKAEAGGVETAALDFEASAEAASADYNVNGKKIHLLLLLYPTQQIAKRVADRINELTPNVATSRKRIGPLLAIVTGASETSAIQSLLDRVHYESKVTWDEAKPGLGLGPIIVTVFTFIGVLLGLCIVVGAGLGGFRILMKVLYPDRVFDRPEHVGIIQLKLDQELTRKELHD